MILFINTFITNNRISGPNRYDRLDVFKYTLASYAVLPYTKIFIYCKLDEPYVHRSQELEDYIYKNFHDVEYFDFRVESQPDWQKVMANVLASDDDLVWLTCNDDHIFIDYNLEALNEGLELMKNVDEKYKTFYFSHWPEVLKLSKKFRNEKRESNLFISFKDIRMMDAIQIFNKDLLNNMFFETNWCGEYHKRTDLIPVTVEQKVYVPLREQCRHFDAYGHVGIPFDYVAPMDIPVGFFEDNIKISFGSFEKKDGFTNINPLSANPNEHLMLEDLPLFWRDKITEFKIEDYDKSVLLQSRNCSHRRKALAPHHIGGWVQNNPYSPDDEWILAGYRKV